MTARDALALIVINVVWGASYVVTKDALTAMPPLILAFARLAIAWIVFALLAAVSTTDGRPSETAKRRNGETENPRAESQGPRPKSPHRSEHRSQRHLLPVVGLFGFCLDFVFFYHGLRLTTASDAAILVNMEAIFTALLGAALLRERIGGQAVWGVIAACVGAMLLLRPEGGSAGDRRALGNALILVALACEALATVLSRPLRRHWEPMPLTGRLVGWGALGLLPLAVYEAYHVPQPMAWLTPAAIGGVAYLALGCTVFCYSVWYGLLGRIEAGRAAAFLYVQPVVGVALGITLQGDRLSPMLVAGGALIGLGIAVVSLKQNVRQ